MIVHDCPQGSDEWQRTCTVPECGKRHKAKGLCNMHYSRQKQYGRLTLVRRKKGTGSITVDGYMLIGGAKNGYLVHRFLAENALGRPLPKGAVVHHVDGNKLNNKPSNLVLCPSQEYHFMLHIRQRAYDESGSANNRKCWICQKYSAVDNLSVNTNNQATHKKCAAAYEYNRRAANASS